MLSTLDIYVHDRLRDLYTLKIGKLIKNGHSILTLMWGVSCDQINFGISFFHADLIWEGVNDHTLFHLLLG